MTTSDTEPTFLATNGSPQDAASISEVGRPSLSDVKSPISQAGQKSFGATHPTNFKFVGSLDSKRLRNSPSPPTKNVTSGNCEAKEINRSGRLI